MIRILLYQLFITSVVPWMPVNFINIRLQFACEEQVHRAMVLAVVTLSNVSDPSLRTARSSKAYRTERMAKRDAPFEAYVALYKAGLYQSSKVPKHWRRAFRLTRRLR
jgi:hypothetical protein